MYVLFGYTRKSKMESTLSRPLDWCQNENDVFSMVLKRLSQTPEDEDYVECAGDPKHFPLKTSDAESEPYSGFVVADLPGFNTNVGAEYVNKSVNTKHFFRRFDRFDIGEWRKENKENERKFCKLTGVISRWY